MKKLLLMTLILTTQLPTFAGQTCVLDKENEMLSSIAHKVEANCNWSISEVVEESILRECEKAPREVGVYIRNGSLRFTEYSYTYDIHEPYYYCKNKEGYNSYFSQLVSTLRNEVRLNSRVQVSSSSRRSYSNYSVEVEEEVKWRCIIPTYVPIPKIYTQQQKNTLEFTYGNDPRFKCAKLK